MGVRERFVRNILTEEGARMLRNQGLAINTAVRKRSGNLLGTRNVVIEGGSDMEGKLTFTHTVYERFLDIKRLNRAGRRVKSNRKIHNRFVFGTYAAIAGRLMYDFTDDVATALREEFDE